MKQLLITILAILLAFSSYSQSANSIEEEIKELRKNAKLLYNEGVRYTEEGK